MEKILNQQKEKKTKDTKMKLWEDFGHKLNDNFRDNQKWFIKTLKILRKKKK